MKKPAILVLALVFAVLACAIAWRALRRDQSEPLDGSVGASSEVPAGTHALAQLDDVNQRSAKRSSARAEGTALDSSISAPSTGLWKLRVHVSYAASSDEHPQSADVRVADRSGYVLDMHQVEPNEFEVAESTAGVFVIAVSARGYRRRVVQVTLTPQSAEHTIDVELQPIRIVRVRWQTSAEAPIATALALADIQMERVQLAVYASAAPIAEDGPPPETIASASITKLYAIDRDDDGRGVTRLLSSRASSKEAENASEGENDFGSLVIDEPGRAWVSAWCGDVLIDARAVEADQSEVVFTTRSENMSVVPGIVSLRVFEVESGEMIAGATAQWIDRGTGAAGLPALHEKALSKSPPKNSVEFDSLVAEQVFPIVSDERGDLELSAPPGWATLSVRAMGHAAANPRIRVLPGKRIDLGLVGLRRDDGCLKFRIVDARKQPVQGARFELVRLSSYDGSAAPSDIASQWSGSDSDDSGIVTFERVARDRYALRSSGPFEFCRPLLVEPSAVTNDRANIVADVVVSNPHPASFVFDPPLPPNALFMIETPDGLPVHTLETTEFGVIATWLGDTDYSLHVVHRGRPLQTVRFRVDANPFVLEVRQ